MKTVDRLTEAYQNALVVPYNDASKFVIVSDAHRGDGSLSDEFTKNQNIFVHALSHYYRENYVLIEAGDGDELWEHHNYNVIKNAHMEAFEILRQFYVDQRFYKLFGNHDIYLEDLNYVKEHLYQYRNRYTKIEFDLFDQIKIHEAIKLKHEKTQEEVFVVHGHQGDLPNDQFWFFTMLSLKYFWRHIHAFGFKNPSSPVRNEQHRHKIEKNFNKWLSIHDVPLICGHTHRIKYPKDDELPYYNSGCCVYPDSMTAIEIENNRISLVRWKVQTNADGLLQIKKSVLYGPMRIHPKDRE